MSSLGTNFLQSTTTVANSALKAANSMAGMFANSTTTVANSALKAANSVSDIITNSTSTLSKNVSSALNSGANTFTDVVNSTPNVLNSLVKGPTGTNKNYSNNGGTGANSANSINSKSQISSYATPIGIFLFLVILFLSVLSLFGSEINTGISNIISSIRKYLGMTSQNVTPPPPELPSVTPPTPSEMATDSALESKSLLNKILPLGQKEVFNVSDNEYTYYDAEPLCRALGAELATYGQVKEAWEKGADWCNYGWVKGQAAVYPTQKETWDKLQYGPEDEKYACGNPGMNGGFFDNPEMKFGVTCYGNKPPESSNDEKLMMENGKIPKTPATLKVDRQIQEYKENIDTIGLLPFNGNTWSE